MIEVPVTQVRGIGEDTANALKEMRIEMVGELLDHFPFRYEDYKLRDLGEVKHDERITVEGKIHSEILVTYGAKKKNRQTFRLLVDRYLVTVTCFNRAYLKSQLELLETVTVTGKWDKHRQTITMSEIVKGPHISRQEIEAIYPTSGSVTTKGMRRFIRLALHQFGEQLTETLPVSIMNMYKLMSRYEAVRAIHLPLSHEQLKQARRRLVYEEFLIFQLKMQALRKFQREQSQGISQQFLQEKLTEFIDKLPFILTDAQQQAVQEILGDMAAVTRMNRLLQGDVGSGKTVVAVIALYATHLSGFQGAFMAPTEILAEQHVESLKELFEPIGVCVELLTGSIKGKRRRELLEKLKMGEIHILIGTHALIQDEVDFANLGLVITDEQHRFGVGQRRILREKGSSPDVLFMTATPIPRTLAITVFGEMDVSIINEMPAGRKVISTHWVKHELLERVIQFMGKEIKKGRQAYVICPLIEESDKLDVQNAIDVHATLVHHFQYKMRVGLMHGRLSSVEKEMVMKEFSQNNIQVLVSTTVVEVGVNVPNATLIVIYDAERFGLSQLHQLRGRVGRGTEQAYCILLADPKSENGKERMQIMTETNDGFILSEKDLELRGPGDFFGTKQSGVPEFKLGDIVHDYRILETARNDATKLINSDLFWADVEYRYLREQLMESGILDGEKLD